MKRCIGTIVSTNYLAYARVLAESVKRHDPEWSLRVLIVDRAHDDIRRAVADSGLDATFAEDLGLPDFEELAFKFELVEFNTALKPTFLKSLFRAGFEQVAYLDPDIQLFSPLTSVTQALDAFEIVLTPHAMTPAMDGLRPSDIDFLRNGAYNLGFVALAKGEQSAKLLDWWESRCLSYGFSDLAFGTFVDQKWMDLVPSYFDRVKVLRDPGCNVAYWNLHERALTAGSGGPMVNGRPLEFFHFSGVKASNPEVLSRHQTRHRLSSGSVLSGLVQDYCQSLIRLGHNDYSKFTYSFARFDDLGTISPTMRRASCFMPTAGKPFAHASAFRERFAVSGLRRPGKTVGAAGSNTLNFDEGNRAVVTVNRAVRLLTRVIGVDRTLSLLKYAAFLTRESNYARVLASVPFDLLHQSSRRAATPDR